MSFLCVLLTCSELSGASSNVSGTSEPDDKNNSKITLNPEKIPSSAQSKGGMLTQDKTKDQIVGAMDFSKKLKDVPGEKIPNQYIVILKSADLQRSDVRSLANAAKFQGATVGHIYEHGIKGFSVKVPNQIVLGKILSDPTVDYAEPDVVMKISAQTLPTGVNRADGDLSSTKSGDGVGTVDVDIAILDTGIDLNNVDLNVVNHIDCISLPNSCTSGSAAGMDDHGHGTWVAGVAAAKDNNQGVVGIAPGARLWAVKVFNSGGTGSSSAFMAGVDYVTANAAQIDVVNFSGDFPGHVPAVHTHVANSVAAGVTYVVAAGNERIDASTIDPASYSEVITVSAFGDYDGKCGGLSTTFSTSAFGTTHDDNFASFSNYGSVIDLAAPGSGIETVDIGGGIVVVSGTSLSSPHVAGAAGLYKSIFPGASPSDVRTALINQGSIPSTTCDGNGHGYLTINPNDPGDPDNFREPLLYVAKTDTTIPFVQSTTPASGATGVALNSVITATFNEAVESSTVNPTTFTLKNAAGISIAGAVKLSGDGRTGIFTPSSPLATSTTYTATVSPDSTHRVKDLAGNEMASAKIWSFTTTSGDTTPPTVVSTNPASGAPNVPVTSLIMATFSEPMLSSSITSSTFTVKVSGGSTNLPGTRWLGSADGYKTAVFDPSSNLQAGTVYVATLTTGVKDQAGNPLATAITWQFTTSGDTTPPTVVSTNPASGAPNVPVTSSVMATFSEPMLSSSITSSTFTVKVSGGSTNLPGTRWLGSADGYKTAVFDPSSNLQAGTVYVATLTTGVKDQAGNPLATAITWQFTTSGDTTPPTVVSTNPASGAPNVPVSSRVMATFSEPMLSSSITSSTFTVKVSGSSTNLPGTRWLGSADGYKTAVFDPSSNLSPSTVYVATLTTGVKDQAGNPLATAISWQFTTTSSTASSSSDPSSLTTEMTSAGINNKANYTGNLPTAVQINKLNLTKSSNSDSNIFPSINASKDLIYEQNSSSPTNQQQKQKQQQQTAEELAKLALLQAQQRLGGNDNKDTDKTQPIRRTDTSPETSPETSPDTPILNDERLKEKVNATSASRQQQQNSSQSHAIRPNSHSSAENDVLPTPPHISEAPRRSNHAPIAQDDRLVTESNSPVVGTILNNDIDPDGDELKTVSVSSPTKSGGTININENGTVTFTPAIDFKGIDTFTYLLSDGKEKTDIGKVSVIVRTVPDTMPDQTNKEESQQIKTAPEKD